MGNFYSLCYPNLDTPPSSRYTFPHHRSSPLQPPRSPPLHPYHTNLTHVFSSPVHRTNLTYPSPGNAPPTPHTQVNMPISPINLLPLHNQVLTYNRHLTLSSPCHSLHLKGLAASPGRYTHPSCCPLLCPAQRFLAPLYKCHPAD